MATMSMNKVIHGAVRRDLGRFVQALETFRDGDAERARQLGRAWDNFDAQLTDHHHGEHETTLYVVHGRMRIESGPGGATVVEGGPGDFLRVPAGAIHRESNPGGEPTRAVVVRCGPKHGAGEPTVNVEAPAQG